MAAVRRLTTRATALERRRLLLVAATSFVAFLLVAAWARVAGVQEWEQSIVNALALGQDLASGIVRGVNTIGNLRNWAVLVGVLAVGVAIVRGVRSGLYVASTFFVDFVATLFKFLVERGRPDTAAAHLLFGANSYGFPSGHTARAAALAGALVWVFAPARWRLPGALVSAIVAGFAMAYARVALGVHFPSDTLGGLLLGITWFAIGAALI